MGFHMASVEARAYSGYALKAMPSVRFRGKAPRQEVRERSPLKVKTI